MAQHPILESYLWFDAQIRRGRMLGYVPRSDNRHIHRLLRQGAHVTCRVVGADRKAPSWNQLRVEIVHQI
jgi:hypothetical protein